MTEIKLPVILNEIRLSAPMVIPRHRVFSLEETIDYDEMKANSRRKGGEK